MPLGNRLPGAYSDWRVVEDGDLHDIARRMRDYDPLARLILQDGTGHLGIGRVGTGPWKNKGVLFACQMFDYTTDLPLRAPADARVLMQQKARDAWRFSRQQMLEFHRGLDAYERRLERESEKAASEQTGELAEEAAFRFKYGNPAHPKAFIPKAISRKEAA